MSLFRVIYTSRPFGYDAAVLNGILADARRANQRDGLTGALICRADIYIQWLEGPEDLVKAAVARIRRDNRHLEMKLHVEAPAPDRLFAAWAMLDDPAASWIWTREAVTAGAVDHTTPEEVTGFFQQLRDRTPDPE